MLLLCMAGCPLESKDVETGDTAAGTDTDTDTRGGPPPVLLEYVDGNCTGSSCTWRAGVDGHLGGVTLDLAGTGWDGRTEHHDGFTRTYVATDGEEWAIELAMITDPAEQVSNVSTTFDLTDSTVTNATTVLFVVTDPEGAYADCATYGDDPGYYADLCLNNADKW
jgi:hypothetical protein